MANLKCPILDSVLKPTTKTLFIQFTLIFVHVTLCLLLLCLVVFAADKGDSVSGLSKLLGSEFGDKTVEPFGDITGSPLRKLPPFDDTVDMHCPSGDILFGSQTTTSGKFSFFGLCAELTLKVTVVVTVKLLLLLLCGVVGFDHRGGGGGGVFVDSVFLKVSTVLFVAVVSILLSKFKVLGRVGFSLFVT